MVLTESVLMIETTPTVSGYVALYVLVMGYEQLFTSNNCNYFNIGNKITELFAFSKNLIKNPLQIINLNYIC